MIRTFILTLFLGLFAFSPFASAQEVNQQVQADLAQVLQIIVRAVNEGNPETITNGISDNARPELQEEIESIFKGQSIELGISTDTITANDDGTYTVKGSFNAKGVKESGSTWEVNGIPNEFVFERIEGSWWLLETNFHQRMGTRFVLRLVGIAIGVVIIIAFITFLIIKRKKRTATSSSLPDNQ